MTSNKFHANKNHLWREKIFRLFIRQKLIICYAKGSSWERGKQTTSLKLGKGINSPITTTTTTRYCLGDADVNFLIIKLVNFVEVPPC